MVIIEDESLSAMRCYFTGSSIVRRSDGWDSWTMGDPCRSLSVLPHLFPFRCRCRFLGTTRFFLLDRFFGSHCVAAHYYCHQVPCSLAYSSISSSKASALGRSPAAKTTSPRRQLASQPTTTRDVVPPRRPITTPSLLTAH